MRWIDDLGYFRQSRRAHVPELAESGFGYGLSRWQPMVPVRRGAREDLVRRVAVVAALVLAATGCTAQASRSADTPSAPPAAGLGVVARIPLPGGNSRFDYASLDSGRGLLFVAHLGASQIAEI